MDFVRNNGDQIPQKLSRIYFPSLFQEFRVNEFTCAINGHKKIQLTFFRANLCNINVKVSNWIGFKSLIRDICGLPRKIRA
jgi:hypothetical protein